MYQVVIAEDEPLVRQGLIGSIPWEEHGMTVVAEASNGQEAWDAYRRYRPKLIITDIRMPLMNGMELIERIRKEDRDTKIIILSCLDEFDRVRKAFTLGVSDYMSKLTMTTEEMQHVISRISQEIGIELQKECKPVDSLEQLQVKENLLKDYMFRSRFSVQEFTLFAADMNWRLAPALPMQLCLIELDNYTQLLERFYDDYGLLTKMSMLNVLSELVDSCASGEVIYDQFNRYIVIVSLEGQVRREQLHDGLEAMMKGIRRAMADYFNTSLTIGVSGIYTGYSNLNLMYREGRAALRRKFVLGAGETIGASAETGEALSIEAKRVCAEMMEGWQLNHPELEQKLREKVGEFLEGEDWEQGPVLDFFQYLIQFPILVLKLQRDHVWVHFQTYASLLRKAQSLREACAIFTEYIHRMMQLREFSPVWSREVKQAINYLEQEYCKDITLNMLASHVNLSANYLGALFKKETGFSPIEYLIQYRISKAKELIASTDHRTYEIAEQIGISDYSYFSRIFRKLVGKSPSEYRRMHRFHDKRSDN